MVDAHNKSQGDPRTEEELIAELQHAADELGEPLTIAEYETLDNLSSYNTHVRHFGTWKEACKAAGIRHRNAAGKFPTETLIDDLQTASNHVTGRVTMEQYDEHGTYSAATIARRFETWGDALDAAGLDASNTRNRDNKYTDDELITELQRVTEKLGTPPTETEMADHGTIHPQTYRNRFGSWNEAKTRAGVETN